MGVKNLIGKKFGKLTVIEQVGFTKANKYGSRYAMWKCICDCGSECVKSTDVLTRSRNNHSCGCLTKEHLKKMCEGNVTHGMTGTRLYGCYKAMMSRCYRIKDVHYSAYGRRGISVCDEWKASSITFIEWALSNGYRDDLTLERINVNGNYEPSNCKWIPMREQYKNKQSNHKKMPLPEPYAERRDKDD